MSESLLKAPTTTTSPNRRAPPLRLALSSLLVAVGGSFNFGYQLLITNPSQEAFVQFLNASKVLHSVGPASDGKQLENEWSSIVASFFVGSFCGAFLIRAAAEKLGRKRGLWLSHGIQLFACFLAVLSFLLTNHYVFIASRILLGIGITVSMGISAIFITECSPTACRGLTSLANGTMLQIALVVGAIAAMPNLLGTFHLWFWMYVIEAAALLTVICAMYFVHETPGYLLAKNRVVESVKAVEFYYAVSRIEAAAIVEEMNTVKKSQKETLFSVLQDGWTRRGTLLGCFVMWSMAMTGITVINAFTFEILINTGLAPFEASIANIFVCLFSVFGILVSSTIIERHGRRPLLLATFACLALINVMVFGLMLAYRSTKNTVVGFALVASICAFNFVFAMGPGPLSLFISGELVEQNARSASATWANATMAATRAILLVVYIPFKNLTSDSTAFASCFILPMLFAVVVLYLTLPETKGTSVDQLRSKYSERLLR